MGREVGSRCRVAGRLRSVPTMASVMHPLGDLTQGHCELGQVGQAASAEGCLPHEECVGLSGTFLLPDSQSSLDASTGMCVCLRVCVFQIHTTFTILTIYVYSSLALSALTLLCCHHHHLLKLKLHTN